MSYFSANLKYLRGKRDLSQQGLADAIGVKKSNIGSWEEGRATPNLEILVKMANYFSISMQDLIAKNISLDSLDSDNQNFSENAQVDAQVDAQVNSKNSTNGNDVIYPRNKPPDKHKSLVFCENCKQKQQVIDAQKDLIELLKEEKVRLNNIISELKEQLNETDHPDKNGQKRKAS